MSKRELEPMNPCLAAIEMFELGSRWGEGKGTGTGSWDSIVTLAAIRPDFSDYIKLVGNGTGRAKVNYTGA